MPISFFLIIADSPNQHTHKTQKFPGNALKPLSLTSALFFQKFPQVFMFEEKKNLFMDFGCFPRDFRNRASYNDLGFGGFPPPTSSSDGFRFSGDRTSPMMPIVNDDQFLRNLLNLNTKACSDLGLYQNLSKMDISDEEEDDERSTIFTGSHPFLLDSGSRNLHGFSRFDQDPFLELSSSRRQASVHSSYGEVSTGGYVGEYFHRLRLLDLQDFPSPKPRVHDRDYLFQPMNQQIRQDSRTNHEAFDSRNMIFPPFSAMGASSPLDMKSNAKCVKKKSLFKEDFINEEDLPLDLESMVGIYGSVYFMAKVQMGCRLLQKFVERGSFLDSMIIFEEVINHVIELGTDQFGNYFVQKLIQVCNKEQRRQILIMFTSKPGLLVTISLNTYGTRVVQKLIETVTTKEQISLVKSALKPGFLSLVRDVNGNRVLHSCLQCLGPNDNKFVLEGAIRFCAEIAIQRQGCCVLQRCVLHSAGAEREKLLAEISRNSLLLAQDPFGNYVVQYIIEQKMEAVSVMFELRGNYVKLATQKFSSHVVEKCLIHYPGSRAQIVRELVSVPNFGHLLQDPFANYVIKSALSVTKGYVRENLVEKVRRYENLRTSPYCKKIFSRSSLLKM